MATATFDTLKFSNALKNAGVPALQAEAEATVLAEALSVNFREITTKDDLKQSGTDLRSEMKQLGTELRSEIKQLSTELRNEMRESEQRSNVRMDRIEAKLDQYQTKTTGEFVLLKWMVGISISLSMAMLLRSFISK